MRRDDDARVAPASRARLLVVEDAGEVRALLAALLRGAGFVVAEAASDAEAAAQLAVGPVDVTLVSTRVARRLPLDAVRAARGPGVHRPGVELVLLAAPGDLDAVAPWSREGACDVVPTPVDGPALLAAVSRAMDRRRHREHAARPAAVPPARLSAAVAAAAAAHASASAALLLPCADGRLRVAARHPPDVDVAGLAELGALAAARGAPTLVAEPTEGAASSALAWPLRAGDHALGVLVLRREAGAPLATGDVARLAPLAAHAAEALDGARRARLAVAAERVALVGRVVAGVVGEVATAEAGAAVRDLAVVAEGDAARHAPFDLHAAVRAAARLASTATRGRAEVVADLGPDVVAVGSAGALAVCLLDVLIHAALAAPSARWIVLATRPVEDHAVVTVTVPAPGAAPALLAALFDPALGAAPSPDLGVGLALAREVARGHGGDLTATALPGGGTMFALTVPLGAPRAATPSDAAPRARLLIVDDEPALLRAYQRLLGATHDVTTAEGGTAALALLASQRDFDLIVCDVVMADLGGLELYRRAASLDPGLAERFTFVTGGLEPVESALVAATGRPTLQKPVTIAALEALLAVTRRAPAPSPR